MAKALKEIHIGVLLDNDAKLRTALSHAANIDYMIEPRDVDQLLAYLEKLAKHGAVVRTLLLMGHGRKQSHHIGLLQPQDVDLDYIERRREASYQNRRQYTTDLARVAQQLAKTTADEQRQALLDQQDDLRRQLDYADKEYQRTSRRQQAYASIEDLFAPGATIGLLNCYADADQPGRRFIQKLSGALMDKHGGRVIANTGLIVTAQIQPLLAWITGQEDHLVFSLGKWQTVKQKASGRSLRRCGVPCNNFSRYGFCDHPQSADGGPCFQHR